MNRMQHLRRTRLYLVRHGATPYNLAHQIAGSTDVELGDEGRADLARLREALDAVPLDAVVASPQRRAAETARILVGGRGLPVVWTPELRERDFGRWEGKSFQDIIDAQPDGGASIMRGPFVAKFDVAEADEDFVPRVRRAIFERVIARFRDRDVLVVSHAGVLMMATAILLGLDPATDFATFRLDNGGVTRIDWYDGVPHVGYLNRLVSASGGVL